MGLLSGVCSRDQSDVSEFLYKMTVKLQHRGNSEFWLYNKELNGGDWIVFENPKEILSSKTSYGIIGRSIFLNRGDAECPYTDCHEKRFLLMDGAILNPTEIKEELNDTHSKNIADPSIILHLLEELQKRVFDFTTIFQKIFDRFHIQIF